MNVLNYPAEAASTPPKPKLTPDQRQTIEKALSVISEFDRRKSAASVDAIRRLARDASGLYATGELDLASAIVLISQQDSAASIAIAERIAGAIASARKSALADLVPDVLQIQNDRCEVIRQAANRLEQYESASAADFGVKFTPSETLRALQTSYQQQVALRRDLESGRELNRSILNELLS